MNFANAFYAHGFWAIFLLALFFVFIFKNKKSRLRKFADEPLLAEIASSVSFRKQVLKSAMLIAVVILSVLALMRPRWGFQWQEVKRRGLDILIAIDTSKSMLASDVRPNRLERSKLAVKDLVKRLDGDRVGLIAFAGRAFLQCPLTIDYNGFLLALNDISTDTIPLGGTSVSAAIESALRVLKGADKKYKALVIITDGEDHEGDPARLAQEARREGMKIFCIGIGTLEGELMQITDENGRKAFLKDREGNVVKSRLNEAVLQKIALATGGAYVRSSGAEFGLDFIYKDKLSQMEKREIKSQMSKLYYERFQIPLAFAFFLLALEPLITDKRKI